MSKILYVAHGLAHMDEVNMKNQLKNLLKYNVTVAVKHKPLYNFIKRLFDIIFTLILAPIALVLILIFGILIKIDSKGPIFYSQKRVGLNGKVFRIIKLRSMINNAEKTCGAKWATKDDPRITKIGKFIRKTRIDELPQLINILTGSLTFVGPRPERPELVIKFSESIPNFVDRILVKPGLTGLAQVNGGYEMEPLEKLKYDTMYIKKRSVLTDIKILFKTVLIVITGKGAF